MIGHSAWHRRYAPPPAAGATAPPSSSRLAAAVGGATRGAVIGLSVTFALAAQQYVLHLAIYPIPDGDGGTHALIVGLGRVVTAAVTSLLGAVVAVPLYLAMWRRWRRLGWMGREGARVALGAFVCWAVIAVLAWRARLDAVFGGGDLEAFRGDLPVAVMWGIGPAVYAALFAAAAAGYARRGIWRQ